jgi:hypothetical protein
MIELPSLAATSATLPSLQREIGLDLYRFGEHRLGAEAEMPHHGQGHEGCAAQQHAGLDDSHPGGGAVMPPNNTRRPSSAPTMTTAIQYLEFEQQLDELDLHRTICAIVVERHHDQRARGPRSYAQPVPA